MSWYWMIAVVFFLIVYRHLTSTKCRFWRAVDKRPEMAYFMFSTEECWLVDPADAPNPKEWVGPFIVFVPSAGKRVQIYGRTGEYDESQKRFLEAVQSL